MDLVFVCDLKTGFTVKDCILCGNVYRVWQDPGNPIVCTYTWFDVTISAFCIELHNFMMCVQITVSSSSASCLPRLFHPFLLFFVVLIDTSANSASLSANQEQLVTIEHVFPKPQFLWCFHYLRKQWTHCINIKGNRFE